MKIFGGGNYNRNVLKYFNEHPNSGLELYNGPAGKLILIKRTEMFNSMMVMEAFLIQLVLINMLVKCIGDDINNEYKVRFKIFAFRDID